MLPATSSAADILAASPDGVFFSNGPGDPAAAGYAVDAMRGVLGAGVPVFGICLGSQILARALGLGTYKLATAIAASTSRCWTWRPAGSTSPATTTASPPPSPGNGGPNRIRGTARFRGNAGASTWAHVPARARSRSRRRSARRGQPRQPQRRRGRGPAPARAPAFSVQYHPEAAPGPHDAADHFDHFCALLERTGSERVPRREDLKSVLVIGSGPIVIGQGCEFDYSGTQACRVLQGTRASGSAWSTPTRRRS